MSLFHHRDHFTMNFNNDTNYNILSGDNLSLNFLPSLIKPMNEYLKSYSVLGREKMLMYDTKVKKFQ